MTRRLPRGWRTNSDDSAVCPHRDLSVCPKCENSYVELVNVYGECFWVSDEQDRAELLSSING
jgi:hypothetical protein